MLDSGFISVRELLPRVLIHRERMFFFRTPVRHDSSREVYQNMVARLGSEVPDMDFTVEMFRQGTVPFEAPRGSLYLLFRGEWGSSHTCILFGTCRAYS